MSGYQCVDRILTEYILFRSRIRKTSFFTSTEKYASDGLPRPDRSRVASPRQRPPPAAPCWQTPYPFRQYSPQWGRYPPARDDRDNLTANQRFYCQIPQRLRYGLPDIIILCQRRHVMLSAAKHPR